MFNNATTNSGFNFGGTTQSVGFGGQSTSMFGATTSVPVASGFGASIFGTAPTGGFGASTFGAPVSTTQQQGFGGFGATNTFGSGATAFGNVTTTSSFGSSNVPSFGAQANTQAPSLFGNLSNTFSLGGSTTTTISTFGNSAAPAFGTTTSTVAPFGAGNSSTFFGTNNTAIVAPSFGATIKTVAPTASGTTSLFGNATVPSFNSGFNPSATKTTGLSFGGSSFGTAVTASNLATSAPTGFNFTATQTAASPFGISMSLAGPTSTANATPQFSNFVLSFGAATTTSAQLNATNLNSAMGSSQFSQAISTSANIFNAANLQQKTTGSFLAQNSTVVSALGTTNVVSLAPTTTQTATLNLTGPSSSGFNNTTSVQSIGPNFFAKSTSAPNTAPQGTLPPQFNFMSQSTTASNIATSTIVSVLSSTKAVTTAFTGFGLSSLTTAASTTQPTFNLTSTKSANVQLTSLLNASSSTETKVTVPVTNMISILPNVTTTQVTTTASVTPTASQPEQPLTYTRLDELINTWNRELEENEKIFLDQTTHVNHWDRIISENGDKIAQLNSEMERLNVDLGRLDQDLDFIVSQQAEMENILRPIEEGLTQLPPVAYQQHTDLQREQIFKMAENLDIELKQVGMDLKEIVDHLNQSNDAQDSADPVLQITKILNEHIDSMDWISRNKDILQKKTNDLAIQIENQKNKIPNLLSNKFNFKY